MNWPLVAQWHGLLRDLATFKFPNFGLFDEDRVSSSLLAEGLGVRLGAALGETLGGVRGLVRVSATLQVKFARQVRANGL